VPKTTTRQRLVDDGGETSSWPVVFPGVAVCYNVQTAVDAKCKVIVGARRRECADRSPAIDLDHALLAGMTQLALGNLGIR
jgi:hypothetical protein